MEEALEKVMGKFQVADYIVDFLVENDLKLLRKE